MLGLVDKNGAIENTEALITDTVHKDHLDAVLKSLNVKEMIKLEVIEKRLIFLTDEGNSHAKNGSQEFIFVSAMKHGETVTRDEMIKRVGD